MKKINVSSCDIVQCLNDEEVKECISSAQSTYEKSQQGEFGKTGQYWMTYLGLADLLNKFHYAIARNDFDLRLAVWEEMLPFCFVFNNVHYARYGTYYLNQMKKTRRNRSWGKKRNRGI